MDRISFLPVEIVPLALFWAAVFMVLYCYLKLASYVALRFAGLTNSIAAYWVVVAAFVYLIPLAPILVYWVGLK